MSDHHLSTGSPPRSQEGISWLDERRSLSFTAVCSLFTEFPASDGAELVLLWKESCPTFSSMKGHTSCCTVSKDSLGQSVITRATGAGLQMCNLRTWAQWDGPRLFGLRAHIRHWQVLRLRPFWRSRLLPPPQRSSGIMMRANSCNVLGAHWGSGSILDLHSRTPYFIQLISHDTSHIFLLSLELRLGGSGKWTFQVFQALPGSSSLWHASLSL